MYKKTQFVNQHINAGHIQSLSQALQYDKSRTTPCPIQLVKRDQYKQYQFQIPSLLSLSLSLSISLVNTT
jgi:hypothetical protein